MGRIVIGGAQSGVGKTTLTLGLLGALKKKGVPVKPFKVGPDYIDPQFHQKAAGVPSRNLDAYMLEESVLQALFQTNCHHRELGVIEGVMGLYDGIGLEGLGSTAHVAKLLQAPVVLLINGSGISNSAAAMVAGYQHYDPQVQVKGVIINQVSGEKHYQLLKKIIEEKTGVTCLGYLNKNPEVVLSSRHLGLIPTEEVDSLEEKLEKMRLLVEATVDIEGILALSATAPVLPPCKLPALKGDWGKLKIAYALDEAFHFYYEDNLDLFRRAGIGLLPFSPLRDQQLPAGIQGIYLGGGFPEVFAEKLAANQSIREAIRIHVEAGMPLYAECGGLMYLMEQLVDFGGQAYDMVGVYAGQAKMTNRLQHFGYSQIHFAKGQVFGQPMEQMRAHEFHRGVLENCPEPRVYQGEKWRDGQLIDSWQCGLEKHNCLAGFSHFHFYHNLHFPQSFLQACHQYGQKSKEAL